MTVLGNIVAVTSIIAVVSLIQGLNAAVQDAILSQAGADSFSVQQFPMAFSEDEFDRMRGNPRITAADADAIKRYGPLVACRHARVRGFWRRSPIAASRSTTAAITGVTEQFAEFSTFNAERGRLMSASEVARAHPVAVIGWEIADRLFGAVDPLEKTLQIEGVHFRVVGVSAKRGTFLGRSQDAFAIIPLRQFQMIFGARRQLSLTVKPQDISQLDQAMDDATLALRIARRLRPRQPDNFGLFTSETFLDRSIARRPTASSRCWSASSRSRSSSAASSS